MAALRTWVTVRELRSGREAVPAVSSTLTVLPVPCLAL
jgi:hypothetical protein